MAWHTAPWEWHFTKLVIDAEIRDGIMSGSLDYEFCISIVDDVVNVCDAAILKAFHDSKV